jgi:ferredoxin
MRIKVDREKCIAAGQCVMAAGDIFDQDDESGIVILKVSRPLPDREAAARSAARRCPVQAIEIVPD